MKTIKQVAVLSGVSVRTLQWYDKIGLLAPSKLGENGYRLYSECEVEKLQQILFFRELGFELKEISSILNNSNYNHADALQKHKQLLQLKRDRLDRLIDLVNNTLKGDNTMSFKEFDMSEIEKAQKEYKAEAEEKYGHLSTYKDSIKKTDSYTKDNWASISEEASAIYKAFVQNMDKPIESSIVQNLVSDWQKHITKYYYHCTDDILEGLGQMYVADQRFTDNIDKYGKGLAAFISEAIKIYVASKK